MNFINELESLIHNRLSLIKNTYLLALLETKLAVQNIYSLLLCFGLLIPLILSLWLSLLLVTGYFLLQLIGNILIVLLIEIAVQGGLLMIISWKMLGLLKEMSFARTRAILNPTSLKNANEKH